MARRSCPSKPSLTPSPRVRYYSNEEYLRSASSNAAPR